MISRTINLFILLLCIPFLNYSQNIRSINISGNISFSQDDYLNWIGINQDSKFFPGISDTIRNRISNELKQSGYFHYSIESVEMNQPDSMNISINVKINEGAPTLVNKVIFSMLESDSSIVKKFFTQLEGNVFTPSVTETAFNEILDYYENVGFPFASVEINSLFFFHDSLTNENLVDLYLSVRQGTRAVINRVEVIGNSKTKEDVIIRASRISVGQPYSQKTIDEAPARLSRLRYFDLVEDPLFYLTPANEGVLRFNIRETQTNNFDGIIGYVPSSGADKKGYLTGFINIQLRNLFGTARNAQIRWIQENRFSQELELKYLEPWLFNYPFNAELDLFQRKQDSSYVQRRFETKLEYLASHEISAALLFATESTIPSENNNLLLSKSSSLTSGVNFKIDSRDDFYAPTGGIYFLNTYKYTSKTINNNLTSNRIGLQRFEIDFSYFLEIFNNQIAMLSVHARQLGGGNTDISDLYFLGGTNTLRGYREKQFQGHNLLWSNLEYRFLLSRRSFAFAFLDNGYFLRKADAEKAIDKISAYKMGYGFGLNIETGIGVLGVSFALAKGESLSEGKIHFAIINEF